MLPVLKSSPWATWQKHLLMSVLISLVINVSQRRHRHTRHLARCLWLSPLNLYRFLQTTVKKEKKSEGKMDMQKGFVNFLLCISEPKASRSIGDVYLKKPEYSMDPFFRQIGPVIALKRPALAAEPQIHVRQMKPTDQFWIFASDGLWEHLSDDDAVQILFKNPRTGIANRLVRGALKEAMKKREVSMHYLKTIERRVRRHFHDDINVFMV